MVPVVVHAASDSPIGKGMVHVKPDAAGSTPGLVVGLEIFLSSLAMKYNVLVNIENSQLLSGEVHKLKS